MKIALTTLVILATVVPMTNCAWYEFWNWGVEDHIADAFSGDNCIAYYPENSRYPNQCRTCKSGYFNSPSRGQPNCERCLTNCGVCKDSTSCEKCAIGYFRKSETECSSCVGGCSQCENGEYCDICREGFYHTPDMLCSRCPDNCQMCLEKDQCRQCMRSYFLTSNGGCSSCSANCDECHDRYHCERCQPDYQASVGGACSRKKMSFLLYLGFILVGGLAICALIYYFCSRSREPTMRGYNGPNGYELWNGEADANQPVGGWSGSTVYDHPGATEYKPFFDKQYNDGYGMRNPITGTFDNTADVTGNPVLIE